MITADEVASANEKLVTITEEQFRKEMDIAAMIENAIYPVQDDEDESDFLTTFGLILFLLSNFMKKQRK